MGKGEDPSQKQKGRLEVWEDGRDDQREKTKEIEPLGWAGLGVGALRSDCVGRGGTSLEALGKGMASPKGSLERALQLL